MITRDNFKKLLEYLDFKEDNQVYIKTIDKCELKVDFKNEKLIYPEDKGLIVNDKTTCNLDKPENFVVFECVHRLLEKEYKPEHIELEPKWKLGHEAKSGKADIAIYPNSEDGERKALLIIECKTMGKEFEKAWSDTLEDGAQLFSYFQQERSAKFLCLYASDFGTSIQTKYRLIKVQDNDEFIKNLKEPKTYTKAKNNKELFSAWKDTYDKSFDTRGLFEKEMKAYDIGKNKYTLDDLKEVKDDKEIQDKYHEFATILRKYNVSGHENAFDKLVNLFLAKVVDETEYNDEKGVQFYWKGVAYDTDFDLQDRLQLLYKTGMKKFLSEDVTYIDKKTIEDAFKLFKNKPDETKRTVLNYFTQLKFYTNNDFAFIDVHNERLFKQNAKVLKEIVRMFQDIKLKTSEQHQFLGDLFEGFLDQGIKQSEGQFFTPMPIVKFLISSLPLENIITENAEIPAAIDYACGAGHFLNEYASQIKSIVPKNRLSDYYKNIVGIEKEYRLSKVAKVSAFMYGQDEINIIYEDALACSVLQDKHHIESNTFSVLVANPPYSVKGFLNTLKEQDQNLFSLTQEVSDKEKNNSIEAFFIERASQLLKGGGVAAIILPSSILSNGNIYIKTREIILKYFDLIAITEFGSGTFGKTGTNTATLFLRRKEIQPDIAKHYQNRVDAWFGDDFSVDTVFKDEYLLQDYCTHIGIDLRDYKILLQEDRLTDILQSTDIFKEYRRKFEDDAKAKNIKKKRITDKYTKANKTAELEKYMMQATRNAEKEKLYFFMLAKSNPQNVIVVKSPADNKAMKQFLGYEWSSAKGNEGIKYIGINAQKNEDDATIKQITQGIKKINTPLFNPNNLNDANKINTLIRQNFMGGGGGISIPESLKDFVSAIRLVDMLDFSRVEFDKALHTSSIKKVEIESKYPLVKLGDYVNIIRGVTFDKKYQTQTETENIILTADNITLSGEFIITKKIYISNNITLDINKKLQKNDCFICFSSGSKQHVGKIAFITENQPFFAGGFMGILRVSNDNLLPKYLYEIMNNEVMRNIIRSQSSGTNIQNLSNTITTTKIPLPPLDIQRKIVAECEKVDEEYNTSRMTIEAYKKKIAKVFEDLEVLKNSSGGGILYKLGEVCEVNAHTINPKHYPNKEFIYVDINSVENGTGIFSLSQKITGNNAPSRARRIAQSGSTIISTVRPNLKGFAYIENEIENTIYSTGFSIIRSKNKNVLLNRWIYFNFMYANDLMQQMEKAMPKGQYPSINKADIDSFQIPVPPLAKQQEIVQEIESYEAEIAQAKAVMEGCTSRKEAILKRYLS
ncbi:N-6 DNA methylase [Helicobacter sp. 11S02629-2]|uniref:N-6 DNA methylase n=1 Tax=Helicobacter sp. 11S02629-2 TaxID=1476195 RepID=UPI000BA586DB|nr:N-6 DNA methylase [Helicobacter sp. 11S02629-2]PAF44079.1 hypothetical protein BKH40_06315 [Helicobacter sp. 11S02629-2]